MKPHSSSPVAGGGILRRLATYALLGLLSLYALGVAAGYSWLRYLRKNDQVRVLDVALFRTEAIRRAIAAQHFASAQAEWDAKNYQAAYLYFLAAVRQDPDNVPGRLSAVRFLRSVGAGGLGLAMLEEGLARAPEERRLIEPTFELLLGFGRERHALDLLRERYKAGLAGPNGLLLQRFQVEATLVADGAPAAKELLRQYGALATDPESASVVAKVLWESAERLKAIDLLQQYLQTRPEDYADYVQLAGWQEAAGQPAAAVETARRATVKFPRELRPRVLLIEMLFAETPAGPAVPQAILAYVREFGGQPEAILELASLAGREGWVDLGRSLYETGANRQLDLNLLALAYSDALARTSQFSEVREILTQLEAQAPEANVAYMVQLRQRQIIASAALGDATNIREYTRRLAALLGRDPDGLEVCRRLFRKLRIPEAVAELSGRPAIASAAVKK
jgi:hypothetical protein